MTDRWTLRMVLTRSQPTAAAPVEVTPGLPPYPGAADPNWANAALLVDFAHYHACGVVPGDTVWDMTGQHQFTIPIGSTLTANGWSRAASAGLSVPRSALFGQTANWFADVIWNPSGNTSLVYANLFGAWDGDTAQYDWVLRRNAANAVTYKQEASAAETSLALSPGSTAWHHVSVAYTDKQRLYMTGSASAIYSSNVTARANDAAVTLASTGVYRMVRIGRIGNGMPSSPGSSGAGVVPDAALAYGTPGATFDPFTGAWSAA